MSNYVNFSIELTDANAALIDQINVLTVPGYKSVSGAGGATTNGAGGSVITFDQLKEAAKKAKKDHGEEFANQVIRDAGAETPSTLGRNIAKIAEDKYSDIIIAWVAGPKDDLDDDLGGDDGLGDDDLGGDADVDPEAVKTALKALSKSKGRDVAKKLMGDNGAEKLSDVDNCTPAQLAAMLKGAI